jgi:hypothetical protein
MTIPCFLQPFLWNIQRLQSLAPGWQHGHGRHLRQRRALRAADVDQCRVRPSGAQGENAAGNGRQDILLVDEYIFTYIYNYFILDLNSDWFTLSHTGSYWVPSSMSLTHDVSLYYLWISLCSSLIWEHDPTWPISAGRCVCVVWRHLLLDVDLWRMIRYYLYIYNICVCGMCMYM